MPRAVGPTALPFGLCVTHFKECFSFSILVMGSEGGWGGEKV